MPLIFRSMFIEDGSPKVGTTRCCLGVRPGLDIKVDAAGNVQPKVRKGLSVAPSIVDLPPLLIPERLKHQYPDAAGDDELFLWEFGSGPFVEAVLDLSHPELMLRPDKPGHGTIGPAIAMPLDTFQRALAATRTSWQSAEIGGATNGNTDVS